MSGLDRRLGQVSLTFASDVDNPLLGVARAAGVYGPQKGATAADIAVLEAGLANLVRMVARDVDTDPSTCPGAGAAGGVGYAAVAILGARIRPGIAVALDLLGFDEAVADSTLVIIGEGSVGHQSMRGKAPIGVARAVRAAGVPVVAVARVVWPSRTPRRRPRASCRPSLQELEPELEECKRHAGELLERLAFTHAKSWLRIAAALGVSGAVDGSVVG